MTSVKYLKHSSSFRAHIIDQNGVKADPEAIIQMPVPQNVTEVQQFIGRFNQLSKFISNCADLLHPLTALLSKKKTLAWGPNQEETFNTLKDKLSILTTLSLYNPKANIKLSTDASFYGLGAVLLQETSNKWQSVAYASQTISDSERHYAQIEKEALALMRAAEKFSM